MLRTGCPDASQGVTQVTQKRSRHATISTLAFTRFKVDMKSKGCGGASRASRMYKGYSVQDLINGSHGGYGSGYEGVLHSNSSTVTALS